MVSYPHFPHSYPHLLITFRYQKCVVFSTIWAADVPVNVPINVPDLRQKRTESCGFYAQLVPVKRDEIGCLRLPTSAANVQIMHKAWAKLVQVLYSITPSNSTSLTASISTRWSQVVSRPYFNKKKRHLSLSLARTHVYILYIIRSLFQRILSDPLRYFHERVPPTFDFDNGFVRCRSKVDNEVEGRVLFSQDVEADFFVEFLVRIKTTDAAEFGR